MKRICVFCGSSFGTNPAYAEAARQLGDALAKLGMDLVYGGGNIGLMGELARRVLSRNRKVTGVIPEYIHSKVEQNRDLTELIVSKDMHERKATMYRLSDGFIALPGGVGTLEEVLEIFTWSQLGFHSKPVGILNTEGFYDGLIAFLSDLAKEGFVKKGHLENLLVEKDPEALLARFGTFKHHREDKWVK